MAKISTLRKYTKGGAGEVLYPKTTTKAIIDWDDAVANFSNNTSNTPTVVDLSDTVQYTTQTKSDSEKSIARTNIGAVGRAEITSAVNTAVSNAISTQVETINNRIDNIEAVSGITQNTSILTFDGIIDGTVIMQIEYAGQPGQIYYMSSNKTFAGKVGSRYYAKWGNSDQYKGDSGYPYSDKVYIMNGHVYVWNEDDLVADNDGIESSTGGTDYSSQITGLMSSVGNNTTRISALESNLQETNKTIQQHSTQITSLAAQVEAIAAGGEAGEIDTAAVLAQVAAVANNERSHRTAMFDGVDDGSVVRRSGPTGVSISDYDGIYYVVASNKFRALKGDVYYDTWDTYNEFMTSSDTPYEEKVYICSGNNGAYAYIASDTSLHLLDGGLNDELNRIDQYTITLESRVTKCEEATRSASSIATIARNTANTNQNNIANLSLRVDALESGSGSSGTEVVTEKEVLPFNGNVTPITINSTKLAEGVGAVYYDTVNNMFVAQPSSKVSYGIYYTTWNSALLSNGTTIQSSEQYNQSISGSYVPYKDKIYLYDNTVYVYNGTILLSITSKTQSALELHMLGTAQKISTINNSISTINTAIEDLPEDMVSVKSRLTTVEGKVTSDETQLNNVESTLDGAIEQIGTLTGSLQAQSKRIDKVEDAQDTVDIVLKYAASSKSQLSSDMVLGSYVAINESNRSTIYRVLEDSLKEVTVFNGSGISFVTADTVTVPYNQVVAKKVYSDTYFYYELDGIKFLVKKNGDIAYNGHGNLAVVIDPDTFTCKDTIISDVPWHKGEFSYTADSDGIVTTVEGVYFNDMYQSLKNIDGDCPIERISEHNISSKLSSLSPHNVGKPFVIIDSNNSARLAVYNGFTFVNLYSPTA